MLKTEKTSIFINHFVFLSFSYCFIHSCWIVALPSNHYQLVVVVFFLVKMWWLSEDTMNERRSKDKFVHVKFENGKISKANFVIYQTIIYDNCTFHLMIISLNDFASQHNFNWWSFEKNFISVIRFQLIEEGKMRFQTRQGCRFEFFGAFSICPTHRGLWPRKSLASHLLLSAQQLLALLPRTSNCCHFRSSTKLRSTKMFSLTAKQTWRNRHNLLTIIKSDGD